MSDNLEQKIYQSGYEKWTMLKWRGELASQCGVYVYGAAFLAKRFDEINYEFCSVRTATLILEDNLYALLRYKYFILQDDQTDKLINNIVKTFCENLKTTLIKVSFKDSAKEGTKLIKEIPISCVAFSNGVYDFKKKEWLFKIRKVPMKSVLNTMYEYSDEYIILWYLDFEFTPLDIDLKDLEVKHWEGLFKDKKQTISHTYNLIHNMSFDEEHNFSKSKFEHLCEILGFTLASQFIQNFVLFIGTGSNGKNSLLDGSFSHFLTPKPTSISLSSIEDDRFVTGALENHYHNFYLESTGKQYNKTEVLKLLTGATLQSVERKGEDRRTGYINTKHIFSANDRDKIKFGDSTTGFARRINLFEVFYKWDSSNSYLKMGDYLEANFSPDLKELKNNILNPTVYVYLGMWGMMRATKNFSTDHPFKFSHNDYNVKYEDVDFKIKKHLNNLTLDEITQMLLVDGKDGGDTAIYIDDKRLYQSPNFKKHFHLKTGDNWRKCTNDEMLLIDYLEGKEVWLGMIQLKNIFKWPEEQRKFNKEVEKILKKSFKTFDSGKKYLKIQIIGKRVRFL